MDLVHEAADEVPGEGHQQLMLGANSRITMQLFLAGTHHRPSNRTSSSNETADLHLSPYLLRYRFWAISWLHGGADDRPQGPHQHEAADEVPGDGFEAPSPPLKLCTK